MVLFVVCDANRRFIYADVGLPAVLGDSSIYESSRIRTFIENGKCLGVEVLPLMVGGVAVRPCLMGDCAFALGANMMKSPQWPYKGSDVGS